ncbi:hypothetical protein FBU30_004670 [Linnemannia zychae]|nr:hypothetical protein FBU30_004670 [Linnemannia zychae]
MQDQDLLDRNPGFSNLITDLNTRFLTPTGTSVHLDQDLHQARYALKHKKSYLETKTVFEPIERLRFLPLDNHNAFSGSNSSSSIAATAAAADLQRAISTHLDRILSILETRRLVIPTPSTKATTTTATVEKSSRGSNVDSISRLDDSTTAPQSIIEILASRTKSQSLDTHIDLDEFVVEQLRPHLDALEGTSTHFLNAIHQSVIQRQQDVITLHNTINYNGDVNRSDEIKAKTLEDLIAYYKKQATFLDRCKEDAVLFDNTIQNKVRTLFDTLYQTVVILWDIIVDFKIRYQIEQDQTFCEYFVQLIESLYLKLEILKLTVQERVYNTDNVARLEVIRQKIDRRHEFLSRQKEANDLLLNRYQAAGPEFNAIVATYTDILRRIDIVQDDIRRLQ